MKPSAQVFTQARRDHGNLYFSEKLLRSRVRQKVFWKAGRCAWTGSGGELGAVQKGGQNCPYATKEAHEVDSQGQKAEKAQHWSSVEFRRGIEKNTEDEEFK